MLVPLDVVQERALHADRDAVAAVGAEGDRVGSEAPAVEVAANPDGHIRNALGDEVVAGVDVEGPILRRLDATREHQAVRQPIVVLIAARVEGRALEVHPIAEREAPGDADLEVTIFVVLAFAVVGVEEALILLPLGSHIRQRRITPIGRSTSEVGVFAFRLVLILGLLILLPREELTQLAEGIIAQRVAEGGTRTTEATEALTVEDTELIHAVLADTPRRSVRSVPVHIGVKGTTERELE